MFIHPRFYAVLCRVVQLKLQGMHAGEEQVSHDVGCNTPVHHKNLVFTPAFMLDRGSYACKTLLINRYSDPSSEDFLFNRLSTCHQRSNQTYEKYADEIKYRLNKIKEHILLHNEGFMRM